MADTTAKVTSHTALIVPSLLSRSPATRTGSGGTIRRASTSLPSPHGEKVDVSPGVFIFP